MQPKDLKNRQTAIKNGKARIGPLKSRSPRRFVTTKILTRPLRIHLRFFLGRLANSQEPLDFQILRIFVSNPALARKPACQSLEAC